MKNLKDSRTEAATSRRLGKAWGFLGVGAMSEGKSVAANLKDSRTEAATSRRLGKAWGFLGVGAMSEGKSVAAKLLLTFSLLVMALAAKAQETVMTLPGSRGQLKTIIIRPKQLAEGTKCPLVVIMHGFTGNKNEPLLKGLTDELLKQNVASVRFDFNGHGESEGEFQYMTIRNEIEDAKAVIRYMQSLPWVGKISVAGHSQGGVVASMVAGEMEEGEITSVVLYAPAAVIGDGARNGNLLGKKFDPNHVPDTFEVWGKKLRRHYIEIARTMPMYETAALFHGPACVIHGERDSVVPKSYGEKYAAGYKNAELHIQPADDHGFNKNRPAAIKLGADFLVKTLK